MCRKKESERFEIFIVQLACGVGGKRGEGLERASIS